jgi:hypothetical protein
MATVHANSVLIFAFLADELLPYFRTEFLHHRNDTLLVTEQQRVTGRYWLSAWFKITIISPEMFIVSRVFHLVEQ